jgi:hypothetical protein
MLKMQKTHVTSKNNHSAMRESYKLINLEILDMDMYSMQFN